MADLSGIGLTGNSVDLGDDAHSYPIWTPSPDTPLVPLRAWFIAQANSMVAQLALIDTRRRSDILFTNKVSSATNWTIAVQNLRIIGETFAQLQLTVTRANSDLVIDNDGQFDNELVGTLETGFNPQSQQGLSSAGTGRVFSGAVYNDGSIKLTAAGNGYNLQKGQSVSLTGVYALDDWYDSQQGS